MGGVREALCGTRKKIALTSCAVFLVVAGVTAIVVVSIINARLGCVVSLLCVHPRGIGSFERTPNAQPAQDATHLTPTVFSVGRPPPPCLLGCRPHSDGANNVVMAGNYAYVTLGEAGVVIIDASSFAAASATAKYLTVPPPAGTETVDDVAVVGSSLFTLDARGGFLASFKLDATPTAAQPALVSGPLEVVVGPYSGVGAALGRVVVAGGTQQFASFAFDSASKITTAAATTDNGQGQPDVVVAAVGEAGAEKPYAFVDTHIDGPDFGITVLDLGGLPPAAAALTRVAQIKLAGAGFGPGVTRPSNFPLQSAVFRPAGAGTRVALLVSTLAEAPGIAVTNVTNPAAPAAVATLALDATPVHVAATSDAAGARAYVVCVEPAPALISVDLRDPAAPKVLKSTALGADTRPIGVGVNANSVIVASNGPLPVVLDRTTV